MSPHHLGDNVGTELVPGHAEEGANTETAGESTGNPFAMCIDS